MITIAAVNSKGGVGKTTLTSALAVRAAEDSPRVAMVDMDPQKSLVEWWKRRGKSDNPTIFEGAFTAGDAVEALTLDGWDYCFLDGPPAFLTLLQEMIEAADFTLIPVKASMVDLLATQDAVSLARDAQASFMCVFNDVGSRERIAEKARELLLNAEVPIAKTEVVHRISHIQAMTVGKSAAEVNSGKDSAASAEIDALWKEVNEPATKAARAKARKKAAAHG
jgi:chromosome partitioning protein